MSRFLFSVRHYGSHICSHLFGQCLSCLCPRLSSQAWPARWFELDHSVSALAGSPGSPGRAPPMAAILFIVPSHWPALASDPSHLWPTSGHQPPPEPCVSWLPGSVQPAPALAWVFYKQAFPLHHPQPLSSEQVATTTGYCVKVSIKRSQSLLTSFWVSFVTKQKFWIWCVKLMYDLLIGGIEAFPDGSGKLITRIFFIHNT